MHIVRIIRTDGFGSDIIPASFSEVLVAPEGVYYTPFAKGRTSKFKVLLPWHTIREIEYYNSEREEL